MEGYPQKRFDRLYRLYVSKVYAYFTACFGTDAAEDLTQQVFLKLWKSLNRSDFIQPDNWQAWIFRVAVNEKNDFLRSRRSQGVSCEYDDALRDCMVDGREENEQSMAVRHAFAGLEKEERDLLYLKHCGLTSREIGSLMQLPDSTVRGRLQAAKKAFRKKLKENGVESDV